MLSIVGLACRSYRGGLEKLQHILVLCLEENAAGGEVDVLLWKLSYRKLDLQRDGWTVPPALSLHVIAKPLSHAR